MTQDLSQHLGYGIEPDLSSAFTVIVFLEIIETMTSKFSSAETSANRSNFYDSIMLLKQLLACTIDIIGNAIGVIHPVRQCFPNL